jgi:Ca-activated chloride channel family protein
MTEIWLRPYAFLLLIPLLFLAGWIWKAHRAQSDWKHLCDEHLFNKLKRVETKTSRKVWFIFLCLGWLLGVIALAGPSWRTQTIPAIRSQHALVVVLDLSYWMNAEDIHPSRLIRARYKVSDLLHKNRDGLNALVVFSGGAHTVVPLSSDIQTIISMLNALTPDIMPERGYRPDLAVHEAVRVLQNAQFSSADIVLFTGGEGDLSTVPVDEVTQLGATLSIMGVGTMEGTPVKTDQGGFLQNRQGDVVLAKLNEAALIELAARSGGRYVRLGVDESDIDALFDLSTWHTPDKGQKVEQDQITRPLDEGFWLVIPLLPLALLAFRRGWLGSWVIVCFLCSGLMVHSSGAEARSWWDRWSRADQRAARAFEQGAYQEVDTPESPLEWRAAAAYRQGEYEQAASLWNEARQASSPMQEATLSPAQVESLYNQANALTAAQEYANAVKLYDQVLEVAPGHQAALHNRDLVQKMLDAQKQNDSQSQQGDDSQSQQGNDSQSQQDNDSQSQQQQEGEPQSQQNADSQSQQDAGSQSQQNAGSQSQQNADPQSQQNTDPQSQQEGESQSQQSAGSQSQQNADPQSQQDADPQSQQEDERRTAHSQSTEPQESAESEQTEAPPLSEHTVPPPTETLSEEDQALEQWLRKIPDDPGGLLRRKFLLQQQRRGQR